jgi:pilus assembly protein Flp/PilA
MTALSRLLADRNGSTAIEYAMIGSLVSVGIVLSVTAFADETATMFTYISTTVSEALSGGGSTPSEETGA